MTVPGKRDQLGNFFKTEFLLRREEQALSYKSATYLVMKAKSSGVIAVSVHSFLSTAID